MPLRKNYSHQRRPYQATPPTAMPSRLNSHGCVTKQSTWPGSSGSRPRPPIYQVPVRRSPEQQSCDRTSRTWPSPLAAPSEPSHVSQEAYLFSSWKRERFLSRGRTSPCTPRRKCSLFLAVLHSPIMANQSFSSDMRRYALVGAEARLTEMAREVDAIRRAFPELRETRGPGRRASVAERESGGQSDAPARGRRRTMTAAERKAVGERMKKYWAARRSGSQPASPSAASETPDQATSVAAGSATSTPKATTRAISPAARKPMSDAQKARWAARRGGATATTASASAARAAGVRKGRSAAKSGSRAAKRGLRKVSAAARKRMSQAQKKRWAAKRKVA